MFMNIEMQRVKLLKRECMMHMPTREWYSVGCPVWDNTLKKRLLLIPKTAVLVCGEGDYACNPSKDELRLVMLSEKEKIPSTIVDSTDGYVKKSACDDEKSVTCSDFDIWVGDGCQGSRTDAYKHMRIRHGVEK